jgi:hypothetical protein
MNDWARIEAAVRHTYAAKPDTARQALKWSAAFRDWLDARGTAARDVTNGDIASFLAQEAWGPGPKKREQRVWAIRALVSAAQSLAPAQARDPHSAVARLDSVLPRSPLGKAIAAVLADARSEGDRRRWRTALGTFLRWCDANDLAPEVVWPGDVDVFQRDYLASGRRSPGEYARVARRLIRQLGETKVA